MEDLSLMRSVESTILGDKTRNAEVDVPQDVCVRPKCLLVASIAHCAIAFDAGKCSLNQKQNSKYR